MNENKLIAEYMGLKFDKGTMYNMGYDVFADGDLWRTHQLRYHNDWNWLMPVVEKILDISFQDEGDAEDFYSIRDCIPDINHTYKAVVEFIKQYNKYE